MITNLWQKDNYVINAMYIHSMKITEYDIEKANISALLQHGLITEAEYDQMYMMYKDERERAVGLMIRDDYHIDTYIKNEIKEAKRQLFESNQIEDYEVLRIANDAVYVMRNNPLSYTRFGYMKFLPKNVYNGYCRLSNGVMIFYSNNLGEIDIDVKGLGNVAKMLHENYLLTFIGNLLFLADSSNLGDVISYYKPFYEAYIKKELPKEYYREFNPRSFYVISNDNKGISYGMDTYEGDISRLDISYNLRILRDLYGCITSDFRR